MEPISNETAYADSDHIKRDLKPLLKKAGVALLVLLILGGGVAYFVWPYPQLQMVEKLKVVEIQFDSNNLDEALSTLEGYLADDPDNAAFLVAKSVILAQKGSLMFKEEEYGMEAVAAAEQAVAADPKNSEAYRALAYAYEIQEKYTEAHTHYDTALSLDPENVHALYGKAHCYDLQGDMVKAEEGYRLAMLKDPSFDQAYVGVARALAAKGDMKGSAATLKQAYALSTNVHNKAETAYSIAYLALADNDLTTALAYAKDATTLDPVYPLGWYMYGTVLFVDSFDKAKYPDAALRGSMIRQSLEMHKKALTLNPGQTAVYLQLGTELSAVARYADAAEAFKRGLQVVDEDITLSATDKIAMKEKLLKAQELSNKVMAASTSVSDATQN